MQRDMAWKFLLEAVIDKNCYLYHYSDWPIGVDINEAAGRYPDEDQMPVFCWSPSGQDAINTWRQIFLFSGCNSVEQPACGDSHYEIHHECF